MAHEHTALEHQAIKIDHLAIAVPDLEKSIEVYRRLLGFQLVEKRLTSGPATEMVSAVLRAGPLIIVLVQGTTPSSQVNRYINNYGPGIQHIAIQVRDLDSLMTALQANGMEFSTTVIHGNGIRQAFTRRERESGMMYEFIERDRNDSSFTDESVKELYEQLERNGVY